MPNKTSGRGSTSYANQLTEAPLHTELLAGKYKKKRPLWKPKQTNYKNQGGNNHKPQV